MTATRSRVYTRTLADITGRVPEVVDRRAGAQVRAGVLDGELIALRRDGRPEAFQVTGSLGLPPGAAAPRPCR